MFGQQAEKLAQHLTKGKLLIRADELREPVEAISGKSVFKRHAFKC